MARIVEHLSVAELEGRYRTARDATEARRTQAIWLLAQGRTFLEVAEVVAFVPRWVEQLAARYNASGPEALGDQWRRCGRSETRPLVGVPPGREGCRGDVRRGGLRDGPAAGVRGQLVFVEGLSRREVARRLGLGRDTVGKMCRFSEPPGYVRTKPVERPKLGPLVGAIDAILAAPVHAPAALYTLYGVRRLLDFPK